jgi:hypothetical protein
MNNHGLEYVEGQNNNKNMDLYHELNLSVRKIVWKDKEVGQAIGVNGKENIMRWFKDHPDAEREIYMANTNLLNFIETCREDTLRKIRYMRIMEEKKEIEDKEEEIRQMFDRFNFDEPMEAEPDQDRKKRRRKV